MMQDNTPINFYIKHFFINCQIKKLQPIFDTFVPPCICILMKVLNTVLFHNYELIRISQIPAFKMLFYIFAG
jgi:hypothetical protein